MKSDKIIFNHVSDPVLYFLIDLIQKNYKKYKTKRERVNFVVGTVALYIGINAIILGLVCFVSYIAALLTH